MLSRHLAFLSLLCAAATVSASGQVGLYAMGSGAFLGTATATQGSLVAQQSGFSAYGGTFGLYDNFLRFGPLKLGADARYFQETSSNNNSYGNKLHGGLAGVRLALNIPLFPLKPYLQAEAGGVETNYGTQANDTGSFAYQIQGGVDYTIFPHLDLRAEYGGGQVTSVYGSGNKQALQEAGLGVVLRF